MYFPSKSHKLEMKPYKRESLHLEESLNPLHETSIPRSWMVLLKAHLGRRKKKVMKDKCIYE